MPPTRPSHRNPNDIQPEVCDLCGALVGHEHLREVDVEGLRGLKICDLHPFERRTVTAPSFRDLQALWDTPDADVAERCEPIGGDLWFIDPENP